MCIRDRAYPDVIPHLTVAYELDDAAFDRIDTEVSALLPIRDRATEVLLYQGSNEDGWKAADSFALG